METVSTGQLTPSKDLFGGALRPIDRAVDKLLVGTGAFGAGLMVLLAVLIFGLTVSRYVLRINVVGLFDSAIYGLVIFSFLLPAYAMREGKHISVDVLTSRLHDRAQSVLSIAVYVAASIFVVVLGWQAWRMAADLFRHRVVTEGVFAVPTGLLVSTIVIGCFLLMLQIVRLVSHSGHALAGQTYSTRLRDNPWLWVSLFLVGNLIGIAFFVYVSPVVGILLFALVILFSGMPVFLALGLIGVTGLYLLLGLPSLAQAPLVAYSKMASFPLTSLPLFILGGLIMEVSGIIEDLFRFFELWLGRFAASPLFVTMAVGLIFCATSGSSSATTAVVAAVAMPVLLRRGYRPEVACGVIGGATVGTLVPPSLGYVMYGVITGESIAAIFAGAMIPSLILFGLYFLYIGFLGKVRKQSLFQEGRIPDQAAVERVSWGERLSSVKSAVWGMFAPILILGGIYVGVYTPTEAAAVLVVYAIIISVVVKRLSWQRLWSAIVESTQSSSMVLSIIATAYIFALVISQARVATNLVAYAQATGMTAPVVVVILFVLLTIMGLFLDAGAIKVILLPVFYPLALAVGIDSVWLAIFWQINGEIGMLTPPVGLNLFVIKSVTGLPLQTVIKGNVPFILIMVLVLAIIYFFPWTVTWLPSTIPK